MTSQAELHDWRVSQELPTSHLGLVIPDHDSQIRPADERFMWAEVFVLADVSFRREVGGLKDPVLAAAINGLLAETLLRIVN